MQEIRVRSLGQEDALEKEMATYSSILACRIPQIEEPGGLQSTGSQGSDTTERVRTHTHTRTRAHTFQDVSPRYLELRVTVAHA